MRKVLVILLFAGSVVFQFCNSTKKASKSVSTSAVTYDANIKPIIQASCSPCHIAGKGNKKSLDNYTAASNNINEILERIQKNPGEHGFMPARHPKLSQDTIQLFAAWKNAGLAEK